MSAPTPPPCATCVPTFETSCGYVYQQRRPTARWECPYCARPVGIFGRGLASVFGLAIHGCDFRNVIAPSEPVYRLAPQEPRPTLPQRIARALRMGRDGRGGA